MDIGCGGKRQEKRSKGRREVKECVMNWYFGKKRKGRKQHRRVQIDEFFLKYVIDSFSQ